MLRLLLTGASGYLGGYLLRALAKRGFAITAWSGSRDGEFAGVPFHAVNLAERDQVAAAFARANPQAVIHAGAMANVAECFRNPEQARQVNVAGTALLTELAAQTKSRLLFVSTDLVFDGSKGNYREEDTPAPLSVYGRTKVEAEQAVLAVPGNAVARVSWLYGPTLTGRASFFDQQMTALREGKLIALFDDEWRTPLALPTAASALVEIAASDFAGLLHVGGPERMSRLEMGWRLAAYLRRDGSGIRECSRLSVPAGEPRPEDTSLDSSRWRRLFPNHPWPDWEESLHAMLSD
jgi:dTDP-4-dehydrorhamnose reductase